MCVVEIDGHGKLIGSQASRGKLWLAIYLLPHIFHLEGTGNMGINGHLASFFLGGGWIKCAYPSIDDDYSRFTGAVGAYCSTAAEIRARIRVSNSQHGY